MYVGSGGGSGNKFVNVCGGGVVVVVVARVCVCVYVCRMVTKSTQCWDRVEVMHSPAGIGKCWSVAPRSSRNISMAFGRRDLCSSIRDRRRRGVDVGVDEAG